MTRFAETLRAARLRAGIAQRDLAARVGCEPPNLSNLESGLLAPSVDRVERLAAAIGCKPEPLIRARFLDGPVLIDASKCSPAAARALAAAIKLRGGNNGDKG